jgi:hypothetical protein
LSAAEVIEAIGQVAYRFNNESELQDGIAIALARAGIEHSREVVLSKCDRIDFLAGDVGIEVKIDGSISALTRQLFRYAELPRITALVVVVGKNTLGNLPPAIKDKALQVVRITRAFA